MRKKVMAFNAKVNAWILKRLKGVWLDPIFCAIFAIMCVASIIGARHLHRDTLYYSALIWALATLLCLRRIQRIKSTKKNKLKAKIRRRNDMSDNMMPELTLNPTEAAQEAVPELTLTPEAPTAPEAEKKEVEPVKVDESMLTEQEKKAVDDFAKKIDIKDTNVVLNYGVAAQKSVATFSEMHCPPCATRILARWARRSRTSSSRSRASVRRRRRASPACSASRRISSS